MGICYDFHIHSVLSPCADEDMTPNNIVNMSILNGLDAIALTDHNSSLNCEATMKIGNELGLIVIPGMELTTQEEIHVVCLFEELKTALDFSDYVATRLMKVKNKPQFFGEQQIMDTEDNIIGNLDNLLIVTTDISIDEVSSLVKEYGGVAYPAHVDRESYSIISNLGIFPEYLDFNCAELSRYADNDKIFIDYPILCSKLILHSSDAHRLSDTQFDFSELEVENKNIKSIFKTLKNKSVS